MARKIAYILKGYPRLSETFIAQEIRALERRGFDIAIWSLRHPTDAARHPVHDEIAAAVHYLPEYLKDEPGRVWAGLRTALGRAGFWRAAGLWLRDLLRDPTANRARRFGQACVLARELPPDIGHLHAHFLHTPASVTRYAALMRGLEWSVSAHAVDIWTSPAWEKREKLADARFCVTCTAHGRDHLAALAPAPDRVRLNYHGLDLARFAAPADAPDPGHDGSGSDKTVTLLSVGRAVDKKGFDGLLTALAALPAELQWRWEHIGGGAGLAALTARAEELGLAGRTRFHGAKPFQDVLAAYRAADLFVLPCRIAANGDRDGLPNVLMEAQSQGLAVLSTRVSAIPELIRHGETGWLVAPDDPPALTEALARLIADPALRQGLAAAGAARLRAAFAQDAMIGDLAALLGPDRPAPDSGALSPERLSCASPSTRP